MTDPSLYSPLLLWDYQRTYQTRYWKTDVNGNLYYVDDNAECYYLNDPSNESIIFPEATFYNMFVAEDDQINGNRFRSIIVGDATPSDMESFLINLMSIPADIKKIEKFFTHSKASPAEFAKMHPEIAHNILKSFGFCRHRLNRRIQTVQEWIEADLNSKFSNEVVKNVLKTSPIIWTYLSRCIDQA